MASPYVSIAGPIGAGKSTLAEALAEHAGWQVFLESAGERNPFLADFYGDRPRWAFHSQSFFLLEAARQQQLIGHLEGGAIQDRSLWEHLEIFGRSLRDEGSLSAREHELLSSLAEASLVGLPELDLLILINGEAEDLHQRIARRGREYEEALDVAELERMSARYHRWGQEWTRCPVLHLSLLDGTRQLNGAIRQICAALEESGSD